MPSCSRYSSTSSITHRILSCVINGAGNDNGDGGGIYVLQTSASLEIKFCQLLNCAASSEGGGLFFSGSVWSSRFNLFDDCSAGSWDHAFFVFKRSESNSLCDSVLRSTETTQSSGGNTVHILGGGFVVVERFNSSFNHLQNQCSGFAITDVRSDVKFTTVCSNSGTNRCVLHGEGGEVEQTFSNIVG
jgi:hypothetical protein